jgi:hypothetical protein
MVSVTDPYGRILGFLDEAEWTPFQNYFSENLVVPGNETGPLDL